MSYLNKIKEIIIGKPLNALSPKVREHVALAAVIAWIGLGSDGLSSSAYGPEVAYLALGHHVGVAIYLAIATAITVFIIALAYNQVIELFPNGGGGYNVATHLLGPYAGVVSGSALMVDYILTIATSIASGVDAIFSTLPLNYSTHKVLVEVILIIILVVLNLRGMKESIKILIPLFIGFMLTHITIILIGIFSDYHGLPSIMPNAIHESSKMNKEMGFFAMMAILLRAYSMGSGTYTGLEAVSNNVNMLVEPRVRTGKITMLYMAISLAFTAGGILVLYLLWNAKPIEGQTLNAVVFGNIVNTLHLGHYWLPIILFFEAALLIVAANTGILACPTVMAVMATDKWLPRQFREVSNRLVTQNGVILSGIAAILVLIWAKGDVSTLVILYSINVFITFSLSFLGLTIYWFRVKASNKKWLRKVILSILGFILCFFILIVTVIEKFLDGGWITLLITSCIVAFCLLVRKHYRQVGLKLREVDRVFTDTTSFNLDNSVVEFKSITDKNAKTAVFFVTKHYGVGLHAVLWVSRLFPNVFTNFIFLTAGEIDSEILSNEATYSKNYRKDLNKIIEHYRFFCTKHDMPSDGLFSYGVDETAELIKLTDYIQHDYPNCMFFASKLVFIDETRWSRLLHNNTLNTLQRQLHLQGKQMVILPMKI
jgi:amino acid transporter